MKTILEETKLRDNLVLRIVKRRDEEDSKIFYVLYFVTADDKEIYISSYFSLDDTCKQYFDIIQAVGKYI